MVGGSNDGLWIGPMVEPIKALVLAKCVSQRLMVMLAKSNQADLKILQELMQNGKVTPVIDRRYSLSEVPDAIRYLEAGHARGKVVIAFNEAAT
jgi:NADPH:quinone reductase-like Zn-dependent oxidoreductase